MTKARKGVPAKYTKRMLFRLVSWILKKKIHSERWEPSVVWWQNGTIKRKHPCLLERGSRNCLLPRYTLVLSLVLSPLRENGALSFLSSLTRCVPFLFFFTFPLLSSCLSLLSHHRSLLSFPLPSTRSSQCTGAMLRVQEFRIRKKKEKNTGRAWASSRS